MLLTVLMLSAVGSGVAIYILQPATEVVEEAPPATVEGSPAGEGELSSLPVSAHVSLARYDESVEFHNPLYLGATKGCAHASVALALEEEQIVKLTLESDCPISWDDLASWENPRSEVGVVLAEMRTYIEGEGWWSICSGAKEVKHVSSYDGGRRFEIVLSPSDVVGTPGSLPPGTGIYKLLAFNLDPNSSHYLEYMVSSGNGASLIPAPGLAAPNLVTPHNGATSIELRPRFVWKAVPGAEDYELRVSLSSDFSQTVISVSTGETDYCPSPGWPDLMPSTQYYWIVIAEPPDADPNLIVQSSVWTFTTASASQISLNAPELISPHNGATGIELTPVLLWNEVPNAEGLELCLSRDYEFSDIIHSVSLGGTAYHVRDGLSPSTRYYWMVAAKLNPADPDTPIACSPVWSFTTAPATIKELYQTIECIMPSGALSGSSTSYTKWLEAGEKVDGFVELTGKYYSIDWSYKWHFQVLGPGGESVHDWEGHWVNTPHHDFNFTPSYAGKYTIRVSHASSYSKNLVTEIWPLGWGP